ARWLHSLALVGERRRHSLDPGKSRQPEREIQQRTAEIEHCTAARLIALLAPTERSATRSGQEPPGANRFEIAELATLHERADHLHVGTIAVRQSRHYHPVLLLPRLDDTLQPRRGHGDRALDLRVQSGT